VAEVSRQAYELPALPLVRRWERVLDLLIVVAFAPLVAAGTTIFLILAGGDWDFWVDWKDRTWWPFIASSVNIVVPAALQYVFWKYLRLPIGATLAVLAGLITVWVDRALNFHFWVLYPIPLVWPAVFGFQALLLDGILAVSRSLIVTGLLGALLWGFIFYHTNWFILAPYLQPADYHGQLLTVADIMGLEYPRTATPEYLRIIEKGALRAFLGETTLVVSFFCGVVSVAGYWLGHVIGRYVTNWIGRFMRLW